MLDDYTLYCDQCANSVEVGFYDPVYSSIYKAICALDVDERDPSAEEEAFVNEYEASHIRRVGIWK